MKNSDNYSVPHPDNACGNGFSDWLEVNLTPHCNAICSWCVEKKGWKPKHVASWNDIADAAIGTKCKNIILLGGEPTLHPEFQLIVERIFNAGLNPWVTTNGSRLNLKWVKQNMRHVFGVNISIHHFDLLKNKEITGLNLNKTNLYNSIQYLLNEGVTIRLNCNCIKGYIDSLDVIHLYLKWAKSMGVLKVRLAELKGDEEHFVNLADFFKELNNDPFSKGCSTNVKIKGVEVNFRQMCGMQTTMRPCPSNPQIKDHHVLYYDGKLYNGWQQIGENNMETKELTKLLEKIKSGKISVEQAAILIDKNHRKEIDKVKLSQPAGGGSCSY